MARPPDSVRRLKYGFRWCLYCGQLHPGTAETCKYTGKKLNLDLGVELGTVIGGRYRVTGILGSGGIAVVFEAQHTMVNSIVALKVVLSDDAEHIARLEQEARLCGSLNHPNICRVYDMGRLSNGKPFVVMERLVGETLGQVLRRGPIPIPEAIGIMRQVLSAIGEAHARGIIHRDITPGNVFLEQREGFEATPKVLDFGLAKAPKSRAMVKSRTGAIVGTPLYMSPEQLTASAIDHRTDLFSAGVILYEMLSGARPFPGPRVSDIRVQVLSETPPPPTGWAPLDAIVARALTRDLNQRYQRAGDFQRDLAALPPAPALGAPTGRPRLPKLHGEDEETTGATSSEIPISVETPISITTPTATSPVFDPPEAKSKSPASSK